MSPPVHTHRSPRLLLVEDDPTERALLRELLEAEGMAVVGEAADGEEGVRLALERRPDVVLMDLRLPGMGGFEATRAIRASLPFTQVVILTAYEGPLPERSAAEVEAYAYLLKGSPAKLIHDVIVQAWLLKSGLEQRAASPPA
ncbi:MAG TPA: response regulator transcription factor [Actinomycetota bacterium]|nr:response regulator transcription factor [Actinomycetota bacterium]